MLLIDEKGTVEDIIPVTEAGDNVETYYGILTPGFINCHCHLELSHLKGGIPAETGLVNFLISVVTGRETIAAEKQKSMVTAAGEMYQNGIMAVADICNTADAITIKKKSNLQWYNLIEVLNFYDSNLQKNIMVYNDVLKEHLQQGLAGTLTPHAPYSISAQTFAAINERTAGRIISVHNQETGAEDELFRKGGGDFLKLFRHFGSDTSPFAISGKSSLQTWLPYFTNGQTILLVHNTFIQEEDILFAKEHAATYDVEVVYCLCPNANLYIENVLPPIPLLLKHNCTIVLGTDSYSSNRQLHIGSEIQTILKHFPPIPLETILSWATGNGAKVMRWNNLGSFERGKKPGVLNLTESASGTVAVTRII